ncbi:MAG: protein-methionine-sulfoxide reductase catalytic subunit MsrP [Nitrospinota bacterium]
MRKTKITSEQHYINRRKLLKLATTLGIVAGSMAIPRSSLAKLQDELGDDLTDYKSITNYNNFYEFSVDKGGIGDLAKNFKTSPWTIEIGGLVDKPKEYNLASLLKRFNHVNRVYRLRCVEAWSMVIPWGGIKLADLIDDVKPKANAKFVRFETAVKRDQMPGVRGKVIPFPYEEGLRLDEATHDLTLLATNIYSKPLLNQNGAPIRLVVPWKYGFKSIKSIVKIEFTDKMPATTWANRNSKEYGFYANVNPNVDHPRWSQGSERRIGEFFRRKTLMFNGYSKQVSDLYKGMDLNVNI